MIKNQNFIVFSDDWGRHPSSCQHIFKRIAQNNKILWINTIGMRLPHFGFYDFLRVCNKLISWFKKERKVEDNMIAYSPFMTPFSNIKFFRKLNNRLLIRGIRRQCQRHSLDLPVLITTVPNIADIVGHLGEKRCIYYCVDDFTTWPGLLKREMLDMEKKLLEKVDLILTSSKVLYKEKRTKRCSTYYFPHGVDVKHFEKSGQLTTMVHNRIKNVKRPIVGYFGLLDERIDLNLIEYILKAKTEYSIAIVGPVALNIGKLKKFKNIFFFGSVRYEVLPNYIKAFDVCILPYRLSQSTKSINPLKLKEYLATGKPVVSVMLPEVEEYKDIVAIADNYPDFVKGIELAIENNSNEWIIRRQDRISSESWEEKAKIMLNYINQC